MGAGSHALPRGLTLASFALATACGAVRPAGPSSEAFHYTFAIDSELSELTAQLCFIGSAPERVVAIDASGRRYIRSAIGPVGPSESALIRRGRTIETGHLPENSCIRYSVDLEAAARQRGGIDGAYRIGDDLIASTAVWLWAPTNRSPNAEVTADFALPRGVRVSPLWLPGDDGRLVLDERAFRFTAYAAFGRFPVREVAVPGACLRVTVLGHGIEMGNRALLRCVEQSALAASQMLGRFPVDDAGLLLVPTPFSRSSPFGVVGRGTMPTVAVLVGERAESDSLARAWVPVHEFSHLAHPYIDRQDAWLSEGIATYYQEILRARGALIEPREAWTHLHEGFVRGERAGTGRSLAAESRDMVRTAAFRRVYWAGAALALIADVEIRRRSEGRSSLDHALRDLNECCVQSHHPMRADEAISRMRELHRDVLRDVTGRYLGRSEFPDFSETYQALGISISESGRLTFEENGPGARLRNGIVTPRPVLRTGSCRPPR